MKIDSEKELVDFILDLLKRMRIRRTQVINNTKIQYIFVADKIYKVKEIDFRSLEIKAIQTDLSIGDVPENEVFPIKEFGEFRVRLINDKGIGWKIGC